MSTTSLPPPTAWDRFRPWRRTFEVGFWVATYLLNAIANSAVTWLDIQRAGLDFAAWEPAVWEWSSAILCLALVPAVAWFTRFNPVRFDTWKRALPLHLLGSIAWSALHVGGMVALRKLAYAMQGDSYDFGPWLREWGYEYLKDVRSYAGLVATIEAWRWFLRRWQGEASVLAQPDDAPSPASTERPERFLVRKLGKEFLIAANDVEALQASGNYVNLRVRGHEYPLRSTMAAIEQQLDPARFVRVHRSHMVNLDCVAQIEPLDTGDARVVMRDGTVVPCSRRYRDALR
ncbi:MAG: LytTR family transcriptional regulator [Lysobacter sp.]|nr:LytTR family transcriptional regulator [Lysobacter sp.]